MVAPQTMRVLVVVAAVSCLLTPRFAFAQSPATRAWEAVLIANHERLEDLRHRVRDLPIGNSSGADQHAQWGIAMLKKDGYAEIATACAAGTFKGEKTGEQNESAETMCPILIDRKALLEKSVKAWAVSYLNSMIDGRSAAVDRFEKSGLLPTAWLLELPTAQEAKDALTKASASLFEPIGLTAPAEELARIDEITARRDALIAKLVAAGKLTPAGPPDAGAQKHLKEVAEKRFQVVKVILEGDAWLPVKNKLGVLTHRTRDAQVLVKSKVGAYCALIPSYVTQPYETAGRYAKKYGGQVTSPEVTLVKCP